MTDNRAVSPVIGVILMVAITVIIAGVVGIFVMDLGQSVQTDSTPTVTFDYQHDGHGTLTIQHSGGETVDADRLTVEVGDGTSVAWNGTEQVSAGDSMTVPVNSSDTVIVLYEADGESRILSRHEVH